jgi:hypothetical protein
VDERALLTGARRIACVVAWLASAAVSPAEAASITVMWDPSPDPEVIGYQVYVGVKSGLYTWAYDVGHQISFVFVEAVEGRRYYFTVAAYAPGPLVGARSAEVSGIGGVPSPPPSLLGASPDPTHRSRSRDAEDARHNVCADSLPSDCYVAHVVASGLGRVTSLAATGDGRLLFVEDGQRVRVMEGGVLLPEPALEVESARSALTHLVVDPAFGLTRFVFVGETEALQDGNHELNIRRYREVQNHLGEGARIVSGLSILPSAQARFTVDTAGRLYVAMPAEDHIERGRRNPYGGFVLHFDRDGAVPRESRGGSPILAQGYARPTALEWDAAGQRLWLSGDDARWPSLAQLEMRAPESAEWPRLPQLSRAEPAVPGGLARRIEAMALAPPREVGDTPTTMFLLISDGLYRARIGVGERIRRMQAIAVDAFGQPVALAAGAQRNLYLVIRGGAIDSSRESYSILELKLGQDRR